MNPKVDFFFAVGRNWRNEVTELRRIVLSCGLHEELKWGNPCYVNQKSNVVLIHAFKEYCALLFFKGALMDNSKGLLVQQTENVQSARQIRFTNIEDILRLEADLKSYIFEAIEVDKAGLKVAFKEPAAFTVADEFQAKLDALPDLRTAFDDLTPGRHRAYYLHFSAPKQAKTRAARVEKFIPHILSGKGLTD
ncbi:MAG: hypothetical protein EOO88_26070 [Pedobacter sp.]|nr:MAG: hypothetical protein EOO88_26070 [Pedobacter sp.]